VEVVVATQKIKIADWAPQVMFLGDNRPITYDGRMWAKTVVNDTHHEIVLQTSRQIGKSVQSLTIHLFYMSNYKDYGVLYCVPEYRQAKEFAVDRVQKVFDNSPFFQYQLTGEDNETSKGFGNGSRLKMRWVGHNVDSVRGMTEYSMLHVDEAQGIDLTSTLPVLMPIIFNAIGPRRRIISGTPLSNENDLTRVFWERSDKREWLVRCRHHTPNLWIEIGRENIGKKGPICQKCGNLLDVDDGQWVAMSPGEGKAHGYHLHQLHVKTSHSSPDRWNSWLSEYEESTDEHQDRELWGLATDTAEIPISEALLQTLCTLPPMTTFPTGAHFRSDRYAGVDWGQTQAATCLCIVNKVNDEYHVIYMRDWRGSQNHEACKEIAAEYVSWSVARSHNDFGAGYDNNHVLFQAFPNQITQNYWSHSAVDQDGSWNTRVTPPCVTLNKTKAMDSVKRLMLSGKIKFPDWESTKKFAHYFTSVRIEEDRYGNKRYVKADNDDMWQALCYAIIVAELDRMNLL